MAGRAFMITGANSGIGKAAAMAIAKRGTGPHTHTHTHVKNKQNAWLKLVKLHIHTHTNTLSAGGTVHMVCRNKDKAEEARADIVKETGNKVTPLLSWPFVLFSFFLNSNNHDFKQSRLYTSLQEVHVHILDLSETKKVWEFAEAFKRKYKALNVLVGGRRGGGGLPHVPA